MDKHYILDGLRVNYSFNVINWSAYIVMNLNKNN